MEKVHIYSSGIVHCSVCAPADMSVEEVVRAVNLQNPAGTSNGWTLSDAEEFSDGTPMPAPCNEETDRLHYLMVC
jgi:hypothetical protein